MKIIKGKATSVRNTVEMGAAGKGTQTTSHVSVFKINGRQVMLKSSDPVMIEENDFVAVAGRSSNGAIKAYAYKNFTSGVSGSESAAIMFLVSLIAIGAGTAVIVVFSESITDLLPNAVGVGFIGLGLSGVYEAYKFSTASRLLKPEKMY